MTKTALDCLVQSTIDFLISASLIILDDNNNYEVTRLGSAIVASSLTPEDGIFVHDEIQRALKAFVMDGEMHIFYMFTPVQTSGLGEVNWRIFAKEMDELDESGIRVLSYVGINRTAVVKL